MQDSNFLPDNINC